MGQQEGDKVLELRLGVTREALELRASKYEVRQYQIKSTLRAYRIYVDSGAQNKQHSTWSWSGQFGVSPKALLEAATTADPRRLGLGQDISSYQVS